MYSFHFPFENGFTNEMAVTTLSKIESVVLAAHPYTEPTDQFFGN